MTEIPSENDEAWGGQRLDIQPSGVKRRIVLEIDISDGDVGPALAVFSELAEHFECSGEAKYMSDIMSEASRFPTPRIVTATLSMSTRGDLRTGLEPTRRTWRYDGNG